MKKQASIEEFSNTTSVPEEAEKIRLKRLARVNPTKSEVSDLDSDTKVSFVALEDFGTDGEIKNTETRALESVYDGYTYFREGDIAIAKITPSFENGKGAICSGLTNGIGFGTTELHVLRPREGVSTRYLWYVLRSKPFMSEAKTAMRGVAGQQRVPTEFLEEFQIPVLPEESQNHIALYLQSSLKNIDNTISKCESLRTHLSSKRNAEITRLVTRGLTENPELEETDSAWYEQIPLDWEIIKLDYLRDQSQRICYGIVLPGPDQDTGVPIIQGGDCQPDRLHREKLSKTTHEKAAEYERSKLEEGDLVYEIRGSVGRVVEVPPELEGANLSRDTARISPRDDVDTKWLKYAMRSEPFRQQMDFYKGGAAVEGIKLEDLRDGLLPVPPLDEQKGIAKRVAQIDSQVSELEGAIDEEISLLKEKRQALITTAVTGQIDMSNE